MSKNIIFVILNIIIFIIISCDSDLKSQDLDFFNTIWELQFFNKEGEIIKPDDEEIYTVQFETDSTFSGINHCNDLYGNFELLADNKIKVINAGGSKVHCGENSLFQDYLSALQTVESYKISGNKLTIFYEKKSKLLFYGQDF